MHENTWKVVEATTSRILHDVKVFLRQTQIGLEVNLTEGQNVLGNRRKTLCIQTTYHNLRPSHCCFLSCLSVSVI
ncbi:CLUMA_CG015977, isoform A [Clunio marinus]|uniref:CLUMA_CG015977, isoform A n=1 Tax=Clunio marinus TaxID=568069 RepID=A0A1J1IUI2_9DIPT|nr:CLUMA_CG015977, isoform A [Clunio marinus]